jgi:hypothetical protein
MTSRILTAFAILVSISPVFAAPVSRSHLARASAPDFLQQNIIDAQNLNAEFATIKVTDACTTGEEACVTSSFAQCVSGKWDLTKCPTGTSCYALPLITKAGTSIACDTDGDVGGQNATSSGGADQGGSDGGADQGGSDGELECDGDGYGTTSSSTFGTSTDTPASITASFSSSAIATTQALTTITLNRRQFAQTTAPIFNTVAPVSSESSSTTPVVSTTAVPTGTPFGAAPAAAVLTTPVGPGTVTITVTSVATATITTTVTSAAAPGITSPPLVASTPSTITSTPSVTQNVPSSVDSALSLSELSADSVSLFGAATQTQYAGIISVSYVTNPVVGTSAETIASETILIAPTPTIAEPSSTSTSDPLAEQSPTASVPTIIYLTPISQTTAAAAATLASGPY